MVHALIIQALSLGKLKVYVVPAVQHSRAPCFAKKTIGLYTNVTISLYIFEKIQSNILDRTRTELVNDYAQEKLIDVNASRYASRSVDLWNAKG